MNVFMRNKHIQIFFSVQENISNYLIAMVTWQLCLSNGKLKISISQKKVALSENNVKVYFFIFIFMTNNRNKYKIFKYIWYKIDLPILLGNVLLTLYRLGRGGAVPWAPTLRRFTEITQKLLVWSCSKLNQGFYTKCLSLKAFCLNTLF